MPGQRSRKCCSSRMTPMQHTRIHARCQSARRLSCRVSPKPTAPDDVRMPLSLRPQKTHPGRVGTPAVATLDDMGYRGEDVPTTHGDWGRQTPWQPSSGAAPGSAGAWDDGSQGYTDDETYPPADGGFGYGPDGGYPGQGQQGYAPQDGQYGNAYGQQPTSSLRAAAIRAVRRLRARAGSERARAATAARRDTRSPTTTGTSTARTRPPGTARQATTRRGYDQAATARQPGYRARAAAYRRQRPGCWLAVQARAAATRRLPAGRAATRHRAGQRRLPGVAAGGQGGYSAEDAGNDWYGGQPAAANGASFADTGTYRLNGRVIDEYGTGPRGALRDPVRGYPTGPGQQGTGPLPGPVNPAASGPQPFQRTGPQPLPAAPGPQQRVRKTREQQRYDERARLPGIRERRAGRRPRRLRRG